MARRSGPNVDGAKRSELEGANKKLGGERNRPACPRSCKRLWSHEEKIGRSHLDCQKEGLSESRICLLSSGDVG